jgi:hypothetical protein
MYPSANHEPPSSPPSLNITNHYLTLDTPTPYPEILNLTITPSLSSAAHFTPIYQRATQHPKTGSWSCAWHKFLPPNDNSTLGDSISDVQLSVLNWNPSPLLMTSWTALKNNLKQDWRYVAYGFKVLSDGEGDTRVRNSEGRGTFLAYMGDEGRVLVGYTEADNGEFCSKICFRDVGASGSREGVRRIILLTVL